MEINTQHALSEVKALASARVCNLRDTFPIHLRTEKLFSCLLLIQKKMRAGWAGKSRDGCWRESDWKEWSRQTMTSSTILVSSSLNLALALSCKDFPSFSVSRNRRVTARQKIKYWSYDGTRLQLIIGRPSVWCPFLCLSGACDCHQANPKRKKISENYANRVKYVKICLWRI